MIARKPWPATPSPSYLSVCLHLPKLDPVLLAPFWPDPLGKVLCGNPGTNHPWLLQAESVVI